MYTVNTLYHPTEEIHIGNFEVKSGELIVSDPCYSRSVWCMGIIENVVKGQWEAYVLKGKTDWGNRCWELVVKHHSYSGSFEAILEDTNIDVGVDSGQAGIYDNPEFHGGEDEYGAGGWYDLACGLTLDSAVSAGVLPGGAVSSAGFGDGSYRCLVHRNASGEVDATKIVFICAEDFFSEESSADEKESS